MDSSGHTSSRTSGAKFAATRWSVVLAAADQKDDSRSRRALGELVGMYWFPLYAFIRRQGSDSHQAEDLVQGFFAHVLESEALSSVDRSKGKFRSFLLASLKNFASDERQKSLAIKRGGGRKLLSLDAMAAEANYARELSDSMTPERLFERSWAIVVLNQVIGRLQEEYAARGKAAEFEALRHTLDGQGEGQSQVELARKLGMEPGAVRVTAHRMRRRYRDLLRDEIMQTVGDEAMIDEEIRYLLQCL